MLFKPITATAVGLLAKLTCAETIAEINGDRFLSPLQDQNVTGVRGVVTAIGPNGYWIRSLKPRKNPHSPSDSVYVYGDETLDSVSVGNVVTLNGRVEEYRSNDDYLYVTEIVDASDLEVAKKDQTVTPMVLGKSLNFSEIFSDHWRTLYILDCARMGAVRKILLDLLGWS